MSSKRSIYCRMDCPFLFVQQHNMAVCMRGEVREVQLLADITRDVNATPKFFKDDDCPHGTCHA